MIKRIKPVLLFCFSCLCFTSFSQSGSELKYIKAKETSFQYTGRIYKQEDGSVSYSLPGVSVYCSFSGTSLHLVVKDHGEGGITTTNYLAVVIDKGNPITIRLNPEDTIYPVTTQLNEGIHHLQIVKRTESQVGIVTFKGILIQKNGSSGSYSGLPEKKMLFIGNSITCGYGNDTSIAAEPNTGFTSKLENNYNSYGHIAARKLNMQYSAFAYSGRGLYKNLDGSTGHVIPDIFHRIFPDDPAHTWPHASYIPDWIVINLGTNDFASEANGMGLVDSSIFVSRYLSFLTTLKSLYPDAKYILAVGSMMNDYYPENARHWSRIQSYVSAVADREKQLNNSDISYLMFDPQTAPYGEDWHPTTQTHQQMADKLTGFINKMITSNSDNREVKELLVVFPNPARDYISIKNTIKGFPVEVYDTNGSKIVSVNPAGAELKIDLTSYKKGTYLIKNKHITHQFIVE